jgi:hypothetical protein
MARSTKLRSAAAAACYQIRSNKLVAGYQNHSKCKLRVDPQIHPNEIGGRVRFIRWVKP